jgi:hypothetical protein
LWDDCNSTATATLVDFDCLRFILKQEERLAHSRTSSANNCSFLVSTIYPSTQPMNTGCLPSELIYARYPYQTNLFIQTGHIIILNPHPHTKPKRQPRISTVFQFSFEPKKGGIKVPIHPSQHTKCHYPDTPSCGSTAYPTALSDRPHTS